MILGEKIILGNNFFEEVTIDDQDSIMPRIIIYNYHAN